MTSWCLRRNYSIVMGKSSLKGLLRLSLLEGSDGIFLNWHHLLRELPFLTQATRWTRREFCSSVNFHRMCCFFKPCCSLQWRKQWTRSKSLKEFCCYAGTLLKKYAVTYICEYVQSWLCPHGVLELQYATRVPEPLWCCIFSGKMFLLPISEILCCLSLTMMVFN